MGNNEVWESQKTINGHVSMIIKMFKVGKNWGHTERVRETTMGEGAAPCPVSLLFKDHKGWTRGSQDIPPTRHVASGNMGLNLHLSELVSDILEPLVGTLEGGTEVISTEDMLALIDELNTKFSGWHDYEWWEGMKEGQFVASSRCPGNIYHVWDEDEPERCTCGRMDVLEEGMVRTTVSHVKVLRRQNWEKWVDWNPHELTREYTTRDMLQEEVQDYTCPMVIIGSDVVSLYPRMECHVAENL